MRAILLIPCFVLLTPFLKAQQNNGQNNVQPKQYSLSAGLEINVPVGDFREVWGRNFVGFSANFLYPAQRLPLHFGFDFALAAMGKRGARVTAFDNTQTLRMGELTVKSRLYSYLGLVRLQPLTGRVSPYIEGIVGLRQFTTTSEIEFDGTNRPAAFDRRANAWTGAYGWSVGTFVGIGKQFYAEGRVERLWGGRVGYVDGRNVEINSDGTVGINTLSSATDVVNIHLGLGMRF